MMVILQTSRQMVLLSGETVGVGWGGVNLWRPLVRVQGRVISGHLNRWWCNSPRQRMWI